MKKKIALIDLGYVGSPMAGLFTTQDNETSFGISSKNTELQIGAYLALPIKVAETLKINESFLRDFNVRGILKQIVK